MKARWIFVTTLALCAGPPAIELLLSPARAPFRFFAADAFYYHTIARNLVDFGFPTFDQQFATNGFHPLWQYLSAALYLAGRLVGSEATYLFASALASVVLATAGLGFALRALRDAGCRESWAWLLCPAGVYGFAAAPFWAHARYVAGYVNPYEGTLPLYGTIWSFMNGMESPLVLFAFGLALWSYRRFCVSPTSLRALQLGLALGAIAVSRWDHALFTVALWLASVPICLRGAARGPLLAIVSASWLGVAASFAGVSFVTSGMVFPVSGAMKSSFPHLSFHATGLIGEWWSSLRNGTHSLDLFYRVFQAYVPPLIVLATAPVFARRVRAREDVDWNRMILAVGAAVIGLAFYDVAFVPAFGPGHWYFPLSIVWTTLVAIDALRVPASSARPAYAAAALCALTAGVYFALQRTPDYHDRYANFYLEEAPAVRQWFGQNPPKIVEEDDGIVAFSTGFPAFSGTLLAIDREAKRAALEGRLDQLLDARGFHHLSSLVYRELTQAEKDAALAEDYVSKTSSFFVVRMN